jgi:hypothetical protein
LESGRTVLIGRRAEASELHRPVMHRDGEVASALPAAHHGIALDHLFQNRPTDQNVASIEDPERSRDLEPALVQVHTDSDTIKPLRLGGDGT